MHAIARYRRLYYALLAGLIALTVLLQIYLLGQGGVDVNATQAAAPVAFPTRLLRFFSYFTVQSNLLVLALALAAACSHAQAPSPPRRWLRVLQMDALLGISITALVFALVLRPLLKLQGVDQLINISFHYLSPLALWLGYALFGPRPRITWQLAALALVWPLAWVAYTWLHGAISGWYPYPFLNALKLGYAQVSVNLLGVFALAAAFLAVFAVLERRWPEQAASMQHASDSW